MVVVLGGNGERERITGIVTQVAASTLCLCILLGVDPGTPLLMMPVPTLVVLHTAAKAKGTEHE